MLAAPSYVRIEEGSHHGDRCGRVFLHNPMAGVRNYAFAHVAQQIGIISGNFEKAADGAVD
jgi:hypothetical protein